MAVVYRSFFSRLASLFNPDRGPQDAGPWGFGTKAGVTVNDQRALQIAAAFRCIRLISETCSSLPLVVYERTEAGRKPAPEHRISRLLNEPNPEMTGDELREALVAGMAGWGNGYGQIVRNRNSEPVEIWPLKPDRMKVERLEDRSLDYRYETQGDKTLELDRSDVLHLRAFSLDGVTGLSPLGMARQALGLTVGAEDYAASYYASGGRPTGTLSIDRVLTPEQRQQIRTQFAGIGDGSDGKKLYVLEANMKYQAISANPQDLQMLQTRAFQIAEIARFFGVPLFLLMETEKSTSWGSGIEQQNLGFLAYTLRPYLERLEQTFNKWLFSRRDRGRFYVEHDVEKLLRADSKARAEYYAVMVSNGLMTRNEVRTRENYAAVEGGDELTAQVNLAPLSKLGESTAVTAPPPVGDDDDSAIELSKLRQAVEDLRHSVALNPRAIDVRMPTVKRIAERDEHGRIVVVSEETR